MNAPLPRFGPSFHWGVASSAYQIEGSVDVDGRRPSTWDTFAAESGRILGGDTGAVACDHYRRYREDVALMGDLGVDTYRFSVAWTRVRPTGHGPANPAGLDFYDRLVDELCAAGIRPMPCLFHYDTPQPLEDAGGWLNRDTAYRFAEYASLVAERIADRAAAWIPINEPFALTTDGYVMGIAAPGKALLLDGLATGHHQLLAHGLAVQALRSAGATEIGTANVHAPVWRASDSEADSQAADLVDNLVNWLWADPVLRGSYPDGFGDLMPGPVAEDLQIIAEPLDFYGLNYYTPTKVGATPAAAGGVGLVPGSSDPDALPDELPFHLHDIGDHPKTDFGWPIVPSGLTEILRTFAARYGERMPTIQITENGCAINDGPDDDGEVADTRRIDYLARHLQALQVAREEGIKVSGYHVWSILDNFEWLAGYSQRFGLVHVDYATQQRTPKASYYWFRDLIKQQR